MSQSRSAGLSPVLAIAAVALLAGCAPSMPATGSGAMMSSSSAGRIPAPTAMSSSSSVAKATYKDGTYSATGEYRSPAGNDEIEVSLTLKDGIITDATFTGLAKMGKSKDFQAKFGEGYKAAVIGKPIDSLSLGVTNGSSLTPKGFMDAVAKIKAEAQA
jgi:major membrane immunogen (membrane-anchored lipoprotein)